MSSFARMTVCMSSHTPHNRDVVQRALDARVRYVQKNCMMVSSRCCKQKWMEIKVLHRLLTELEEEDTWEENEK